MENIFQVVKSRVSNLNIKIKSLHLDERGDPVQHALMIAAVAIPVILFLLFVVFPWVKEVWKKFTGEVEGETTKAGQVK